MAGTTVENPRESLPRRALAMEGRIETLLHSNLLFVIVLAAISSFVVALRLVVALTSPVVGPDYGHYLIAANWYLGQDRSGEGPFDPPFVPLLVIGLTPVLGTIGTLQVLGAVAAASILAPAAFLMQRFVPRWTAILAASVFALWEGFTDFITFGGVTNLFGIAFSLVFFYYFFSALEEPTRGIIPRRLDVISALLAFAVVSVHHLTAFVTGATVLVWVGSRIVQDRRTRRAVAWTALRVGALAVAMSAVYLPYLFGVTSNDIAGGLGRPFPIANVGTLLDLAWRFNPLLWLVFLLIGIAAFVRFDRATTLLPFALALLMTPMLLVLTILASHPVRGLYFEQFPIVFAAALWGQPGTSRFFPRKLPGMAPQAFRSICFALLLISVPLLAMGAPDVQRAGMAITHDFMTPQTLEALDWIRQETAPDAVFAVDGAVAPVFNELWRGTGLGWWLEGYADRRAIYVGHPPLLISQSKWEDARDANRLFSGDTIFEDGTLRVADSFPFDDGASPMVYSSFLQDYHELGGLSAPRIVDFENLPAYPLILAANQSARSELNGQIGRISGTYSGRGFSGSRTLTYNGSQHAVELELALTVGPASGWDGIEVTVRLPPRTEFDLSALWTGLVSFDVATFPGSPDEHGSIQFFTANLSIAQTTNAPDGIGLRWVLTGSSIVWRADLSFARLSSPPCEGCPLAMRTSSEILRERSVGFLFVPVSSSRNIRRFDREPARYSPMFSNAVAAIYRVDEPNL